MAVQYASDAARDAVARRRGLFTSRVSTVSGAGLLLALLSTALLASSAHAQSVGLGTADRFAVLGGSTVTNTGPTLITGDLGVTPGTAVTGAPLVLGGVHRDDAIARQARIDATTAYGEAAGRPSSATVTGDLGGRTLTRGVYTSASSLGLTGDLTLDAQGDPRAVFIFQAGSTLRAAAGSRVVLTGGAQACNIYWQVGSSATIEAASAFKGTILALTSVTLTTGATIDGRALARTGAVTLDTNTITRSSCAATPPTGTPTAGATPDTGPTAGAGATPRAGTTGTTGTTRTRALRPGGTARLVPGPRSGPRQGPPRSGQCASRPFTIRVAGRNISKVSFFAGGRLLSTVKARPGRKVFALRMTSRRQDFRYPRVTARVSFTAASRTKTKTLRLTYQRCRSVQPRFTG